MARFEIGLRSFAKAPRQHDPELPGGHIHCPDIQCMWECLQWPWCSGSAVSCSCTRARSLLRTVTGVGWPCRRGSGVVPVCAAVASWVILNGPRPYIPPCAITEQERMQLETSPNQVTRPGTCAAIAAGASVDQRTCACFVHAALQGQDRSCAMVCRSCVVQHKLEYGNSPCLHSVLTTCVVSTAGGSRKMLRAPQVTTPPSCACSQG